jgi:hypothetical protein
MKQYVIDQLHGDEIEKIRKYLHSRLALSGVDGLFWLPVEDTVLSSLQQAHEPCKPHCVAIELEDGRLVCELLVRSRQQVRCDCMSYATVAQRNWLIDMVDAMLQELDIRI